MNLISSIPLIDDLKYLKGQRDHFKIRAHKFITSLAVMRQQTLDNIVEEFTKMIDAAMFRLRSDQQLGLNVRAPRIIHKIWLTNTNSPTPIPEKYIPQLISDSKLHVDRGWRYFLWVQNEALFPDQISALRAADAPIQVKSITEDLPLGEWNLPFEAMISDRKFPFAADILRMVILYNVGGLYSDLGAKFTSIDVAENVISNFSYSFILWENLFFQNSLMMMPPKSPLGQEYFRVLAHPEILPSKLFDPFDGISEGWIISGLMITAIVLANPELFAPVCPLAPNRNAISWGSEQSWYTNDGENRGKYGNAFVPSTGPSYFQEETLKRNSEALDHLFSGTS